jgi:hypothetical protein
MWESIVDREGNLHLKIRLKCGKCKFTKIRVEI